MFHQLSLKPVLRQDYQEYKLELDALLENRNEHAQVLDIMTSEHVKIVKHIKKHEQEIYRWVRDDAPFPFDSHAI
jgi:hypothetical protein